MSIFKRKNELQDYYKQRVVQLEENLLEKTVQLQMMTLSAAQADVESQEFKGNHYTSYETAIAEINARCNCTADWGQIFTPTIVDMRAAFVLGTELESKIDEIATERERAWFEEYIRFNTLDGSFPLEVAKSAEKEGRILLRLTKDEEHEWEWADKAGTDHNEKGMVKVRVVLYSDGEYIVVTNQDDYKKIEKVTFDDDSKPDLNENECVYRKYGGNITDPNYAVMKVWRVLDAITNLEKALADLRLIDNMFATPCPVFKCKTIEEAKDVDANLPNNWKGKKRIVTTADVTFPGPDMKGIETIIKEIQTNAVIISGATSIPIHFLGFSELMSNRATAAELINQVNAGTTQERSIFLDAFNETKDKAAAMQGEIDIGEPINSKNFEHIINVVTEEHWKRIKEVMLPATDKGLISREGFLETIPGIDAKAELERIEADGKKADEKEINIAKVLSTERAEEIEEKEETNATGRENTGTNN